MFEEKKGPKVGRDAAFGHKRRVIDLTDWQIILTPEKWRIRMNNEDGRALPINEVRRRNDQRNRHFDPEAALTHDHLGCSMTLQHLNPLERIVMEQRYATTEKGRLSGELFYKVPIKDIGPNPTLEACLTVLKSTSPVFPIIKKREDGSIVSIALLSYNQKNKVVGNYLDDENWDGPRDSAGNRNRIVNTEISKRWSDIRGYLFPREIDGIREWFEREIFERQKKGNKRI